MSRQAPRRTLRELIGFDQPYDEVYRMLDWPLTVRIGGALWLIGLAASIAVLPVASPTHWVGGAGYVLVGVLVGASAAVGVYLIVRPERISPVGLLVLGYVGIVGLAAGQLLVGHRAAPQMSFLLAAAFHASVHPARRALPLLAFTVVAKTASSVVTGPSSLELVQSLIATTLLIILSVLALINATVTRSLAADLELERNAAEDRARTDSLTKLLNRRAFDEALAREVAASDRYGRSLSAVMLDIDHFKSINDRWGHPAGDAALAAVARVLDETIRAPDTCFRWGGDEFAVLLPETTPGGARALLARLQERVAHETHLPDGRPVKVSGGVADRRTGESGGDLARRADVDLFVNKRAITTEQPRPAEVQRR